MKLLTLSSLSLDSQFKFPKGHLIYTVECFITPHNTELCICSIEVEQGFYKYFILKSQTTFILPL